MTSQPGFCVFLDLYQYTTICIFHTLPANRVDMTSKIVTGYFDSKLFLYADDIIQ